MEMGELLINLSLRRFFGGYWSQNFIKYSVFIDFFFLILQYLAVLWIDLLEALEVTRVPQQEKFWLQNNTICMGRSM